MVKKVSMHFAWILFFRIVYFAVIPCREVITVSYLNEPVGASCFMNKCLRTTGKRYVFLVSISTVILALSSCIKIAAKYPYTLNEHYKTANLSDRKLVVVFPGDNNIIINNKKDVVNDYGGLNAKPEARIRKFYFPEMLATIKSFVSGDSLFDLEHFRPGLAWDTLSTKVVTLKTGSDSIPVQYSVPEKTRMQAVGMDSAVVIIIESIEFKRNNFKCEYYWDDKSRVPANLEVNAKILIWDFKNNLPVFYGPVSSKVEFHFGLQRKHWDESAGTLAKKLIVSAKCL